MRVGLFERFKLTLGRTSSLEFRTILKVAILFGFIWGSFYLLKQQNPFIGYSSEFGEKSLLLPNFLGVLFWLFPAYIVLKLTPLKSTSPLLKWLGVALFIAFLSVPLGTLWGSIVAINWPLFWTAAFYLLSATYLLSMYVVRKDFVTHVGFIHIALFFISLLFMTLWYPIVFVVAFGIAIKELAEFLLKNAGTKGGRSVLYALLVLASVAFAYLLIGLLAKADPIFDSVYTFLTKYLLLQKWLALGFYIIAGVVVIVSFTVLVLRIAPKLLLFLFYKPKHKGLVRKSVGKLTSTVPLLFYLVPLLILGLFFAVQLYVIVFLGKANLLSYYHLDNYAQYAKRGVVELLLGSGLFVVSLFFLYLSFFAKNKKTKKINLWILVLVAIGLVILGGLSLYKVFLYLKVSGFTLKRVWALYFVLAYLIGIVLVMLGVIKDVKSSRPVYYSFWFNGVSLRIVIWFLFTFAGFMLIPWLNLAAFYLVHSAKFINIFNPRYAFVSPTLAQQVKSSTSRLKQNLVKLHALEQYGDFYLAHIQKRCAMLQKMPYININIFVKSQDNAFDKMLSKACVSSRDIKRTLDKVRGDIFDSLRPSIEKIGVYKQEFIKGFSCSYEYAPADEGGRAFKTGVLFSKNMEALICSISNGMYKGPAYEPYIHTDHQLDVPAEYLPKAYIVFRDAQDGKILVDIYNSKGEKSVTLQF